RARRTVPCSELDRWTSTQQWSHATHTAVATRHCLLHRVRQARKRKVAHAKRRHHHVTSTLGSRNTTHPSHLLEVVQHEERRLVEAEIAQGARYAAILHQESAVPREARVEQRTRIHRPQVPQPRDQHPAPGSLHQLIDRCRTALHSQRRGVSRCLLSLLVRPETGIHQLVQHSITNPHLTTQRHALEVERRGQEHRVRRIGQQRYPLIHDPLADLVAAPLLHERASTLIRTTRIGVAADQLHQVANRLRLQNYRVPPGLDCLWLPGR